MTAPVPLPDAVTQEYWSAIKATGLLHIQHCARCGTYQHFPEPNCVRCGREDALAYRPVSGRGTVYSFVVTHQTRLGGLAARVPFVIAWIELPEQAGLRVVANVLNCPPPDVHIGMPVTLVLEERDGWVIPQFEPAAGD